ncbi:TetR/AcrR family transcriptional regulator [uncultured Microbacterium sp.]|uniref:TetR/AcrR family transcriptional regulator n=1 Tax=uncultured Microbacterium sp. TaxID=191216 RepID=UPI0035CC7F7F
MTAVNPADAPKRGRPRDEGARTAILSATASLLAERGYDGVTMDGIAARAGVGKQTVYRWWPTKVAVIGEAILDDFIVGPDLEVPYSSDVWADLETWMRSGEDGYRENGRDLIRVSTAVASEDEAMLERMTAKFAAPARIHLHARLRAAVDAGQINDTIDLAAVVSVLQAVISYAGIMRADEGIVSDTLAIIRAASQP